MQQDTFKNSREKLKFPGDTMNYNVKEFMIKKEDPMN
jgi:hypothetical protein